MKVRKFLMLAVLGLFLSSAAFVFAQEDSAAADDNDTRVVIYPFLWQVPLYGASVDLPSLPDGGGGGGGEAISNSTGFELNGAFLAGLTVEQKRWFVDFEGTYATLASERDRPFLRVDTDLYYFDLTGGWKFHNNLAVTGGVKYLAVDIHANLNDQFDARIKPDLWDPMIGIDYRQMIGKKLWLNARFEGGGFGVGTDADLSAKVVADWEVLPHFVLDAGYNFLYFKYKVGDVTVGNVQRELEIEQTLSGPRLGIGFVF